MRIAKIISNDFQKNKRPFSLDILHEDESHMMFLESFIWDEEKSPTRTGLSDWEMSSIIDLILIYKQLVSSNFEGQELENYLRKIL